MTESNVSAERLALIRDGINTRLDAELSGAPDLDRDIASAITELLALRTAEAQLKAAREALKWFVDRSQPIQAKFALHGPKDTADAMVDAFRAARAALSQEAPK